MWQQARTSLCVSQKPVADEAKPIKPWWNKGNKGRWQGIWCKLSEASLNSCRCRKSLYCCSSIDVTLPVDCNLTFCMTKKNALTRIRTAQENTIPSFLSFWPTLFPNTWRQAVFSPPDTAGERRGWRNDDGMYHILETWIHWDIQRHFI